MSELVPQLQISRIPLNAFARFADHQARPIRFRYFQLLSYFVCPGTFGGLPLQMFFVLSVASLLGGSLILKYMPRFGAYALGGIIAVILANIVAFFLMRMIGKNLDA